MTRRSRSSVLVWAVLVPWLLAACGAEARQAPQAPRGPLRHDRERRALGRLQHALAEREAVVHCPGYMVA